MLHAFWLPDFKIGLRLVLRARVLSVSLWLFIALAVVVFLSAQFSGRQPSTVALDVGISAIRLALPLMAVLLAQELFSREFERRYFLTSLTYPRPRHHLFVGRFITILCVLLLILTMMALLLGILVWYIGQDYEQATPVALDHRYLLTIGFIALDTFVILALSSLLAITATTPSFILIGTFGFMVMARSFSTIILMVSQQSELVSNPELYRETLGIMTYLLPDLGALDIRAITLYGTMEYFPTDWPARLVSIIAYGFVLIGTSLWALQRKHLT